MNKLLVIDGNSILNRAFYGIRRLTTKDGLCTNAIFGTVNIIYKHIKAYAPDYCVVAFDVKAPTFRHKMYDGYKATRKPMPDDLAVQLPYIKECLAAMGIKMVELPGYEADDIIGTVTKRAELENIYSYISTGDRDSLQLISDSTVVLLASNNDTLVVDTDMFADMYGVTPPQLVEIKALMGDSSDNIPGVPGIGEVTAKKLIADYGDIDNLYNGIEDKKLAPSTLTKLIIGREKAFISRKLALIDRDIPLDIDFSNIKYNGIDRARLRNLFVKFEFGALIKRMGLDSDENTAEGDESKKPLPVPKVVDFQAVLSSLSSGKRFAVIYDGDADCYRFSNNELCSDASVSLTKESDVFFKYSDLLITYDSKSFYGILKKHEIKFKALSGDIMLGAYIASSNDNDFSLGRILLKYLGISSQADFKAVPLLIFVIDEMLHEEMLATGQLKLYTDIELPLAKLLFEIEETGFKIDSEKMKAFSKQLEILLEQLTERIYMSAGCEFNIKSPKQLGEVLFEQLGLPCEKKTKTGYSTNVDVLNKLRPFHPIIEDILDYRQVDKLKSTYTEGLVAAADENGRVHTIFKQAVTATGRLSSTEPNLQNIPIRTELGRELRKYFVAESGYLLIDADYSQIELRLLAAISHDETMCKAFADGVDIHSVTASEVFRVPLDSVTPEQRKRAKAVNFGIVYGIGDYTLSTDLHVSRKTAAEYIKNYLLTYPSVDKHLHDTVKQAKADGYVTTLFGRRRYIPELSSPRQPERAFGERVAMNSPIQGSAADIIKLAMIEAAKRLESESLDARMVMQVHDELIIEASESCAERVAEILKDAMEHAVKLEVSLNVEVGVGKTWFDAK